MGYQIPAIPDDLLTSKKERIRRLRVDIAQTGFFDGREFRTFKELSVTTTEPYVIQIVVPVNTILAGLQLTLDNGSIRMSTSAGGTPGGTFSESLPVIAKNRMTDTPAYTAQNTLTAGGTITGGIVLDVIRVSSGGGNNNPSIGFIQGDERGILPGTYYFNLENIGTQTATGTLKLNWEERP